MGDRRSGSRKVNQEVERGHLNMYLVFQRRQGKKSQANKVNAGAPSRQMHFSFDSLEGVCRPS